RAIAVNAADHAATGGGACNLFDLGLAIDSKHRDAALVGVTDLALFLDGVAVGDTVGGSAGSQHLMGLVERGHIEAATEFDQKLQNFGRRVRLDGVVDPGVRQCLGEAKIILADDIKIDNEAGAVFSTLLEEFADACGHLDPAPLSGRWRSHRGEPPMTLGCSADAKPVTSRDCCLGPDEGNPVPHCWQRWTSLFGVPGIGAGSNQKSPSVVALSRVASGELALPVSPPAAGRGCKEVASLP